MSERKLATIEKISGIYPIEGADAIERAEVRGWNVVIKKGEFKEGDFCVYCEIDSLLPERPEFEFLRKNKFRIRTIKLRGQVSQGIVFPISILESFGELVSVIGEQEYDTILVIRDENVVVPIVQGEDVTDLLGVTKFEPPIPASLGGDVKGNFPSHSIKTDEERIQNLKNNYDKFKEKKWVVTEKLDGSSCTAFIFDGEYGMASRNLTLKESEKNSFWKVARALQLEEKMKKYMSDNNIEALTLQGELIGEGIQKNKYKLKGQDLRFFRAFDPISYKFYSMEELQDMLDTMS
ncbi:MAG: RNA ligase (ATP), partial [Nanoarchaeota archaeon]